MPDLIIMVWQPDDLVSLETDLNIGGQRRADIDYKEFVQ